MTPASMPPLPNFAAADVADAFDGSGDGSADPGEGFWLDFFPPLEFDRDRDEYVESNESDEGEISNGNDF
jgi:hypothetical protein